MLIKNHFKESLDVIKTEMLHLCEEEGLAKDAKFLRKMAINIKHLDYNVKKAITAPKCSAHAKKIAHFLSTPMQASPGSPITLSKAADTFSEQNPLESDLSHLLASSSFKKTIFKRGITLQS